MSDHDAAPAASGDSVITVHIDRDVCMGSGNCVYAAVGAFELDDDGVGTVVDPTAVPVDTLVTAARQCPTHAITVQRDGTPVV